MEYAVKINTERHILTMLVENEPGVTARFGIVCQPRLQYRNDLWRSHGKS
jgi:hypothetical protein